MTARHVLCAVEMQTQDQRGGDRQPTGEYLIPGDEDHGPPLAEYHVLLPRQGRAAEDVNRHVVREALLIGTRTTPQWVQLTRCQTRLLQQLAASGLLSRFAGLDPATRQAPLTR